MIPGLTRIEGAEDQGEVLGAHPYRYVLMGVNDSGEINTLSKSSSGFCEKVFILGENQTAELTRSGQKLAVRKSGGPVFLSRQNVKSLVAKCPRDGEEHVNVRIKPMLHDAAAALSIRRRRCTGLMDASSQRSSASLMLILINRSISF